MAESGYASIEGRRIAYRRHGSGGKGSRIVLLNGHNTPMTAWSRLFPAIEAMGCILTYDRLGTGKSEKPVTPQHGLAILDGFQAVTAAAGLAPPFVLVGHSLGGLYANLFARVNPDRIAGVVFVESGHPDEAKDHPEPGPLGRLLDRLIGGSFRRDPNSEFNGVAETVHQIEAAGPFPAIPVSVVTGRKKMPFVPAHAHALHMEKQTELAALGSDARHFFAENSGHGPQLTEPQIVLEAIAWVIERSARKQR